MKTNQINAIGISLEPQKKDKWKGGSGGVKLRLKRWVRATILLCALAAICCVAISILHTQQVRLDALTAKAARLEEEKQKAQIKLDGMERMAEFSKSDEYIEQQARSILGWIRGDEILFSETDEKVWQDP